MPKNELDARPAGQHGSKKITRPISTNIIKALIAIPNIRNFDYEATTEKPKDENATIGQKIELAN
jgi:hypothetical protein